MLIGALPINTFGCGMYRVIIPMRKLEEKYPGYKTHALFTKHLNQIEPEEYKLLNNFASDKDVILVQRRTGPDWNAQIINWILEGKKVVYELDDTYEGIPIYNLKLNARYMCHPETKSSLLRILDKVDLVTVSTPELHEWVCRFCNWDKVRLLKNTLDFSLWPKPHFGEKPKDEPLIIGFAGAESHSSDLPELGASLEVVNRQFNHKDKTNILFGFFGFMLEQFWRMEPHVSFATGVPFLEYPPKLATLKYDIGLAPLKQCFFNECKSELRFLEHAALGVPIVATDIAPFRRVIQNDRGILVKNKTRKWVSAIKTLIQDKELRKTMGKNAYNYVREEYNIDKYITEWHEAYGQLT